MYDPIVHWMVALSSDGRCEEHQVQVLWTFFPVGESPSFLVVCVVSGWLHLQAKSWCCLAPSKVHYLWRATTCRWVWDAADDAADAWRQEMVQHHGGHWSRLHHGCLFTAAPCPTVQALFCEGCSASNSVCAWHDDDLLLNTLACWFVGMLASLHISQMTVDAQAYTGKM